MEQTLVRRVERREDVVVVGHDDQGYALAASRERLNRIAFDSFPTRSSEHDLTRLVRGDQTAGEASRARVRRY